MRIFRRYRCDFEHEWIVTRGHDEEEQPGDALCPKGHPAITCRVEPPVDDVQILFVPAARIVNLVKNQRILNERYYLSLLDKAGKDL